MLRCYYIIFSFIFTIARSDDISCLFCKPEDEGCVEVPPDTIPRIHCSQMYSDNTPPMMIDGFRKEIWDKSTEVGILVELSQQSDNATNEFNCYSVIYQADKFTKGVYRGCVIVRDDLTACDLLEEEFQPNGISNCTSCKYDDCNYQEYKNVRNLSKNGGDTKGVGGNDDGSATRIDVTSTLLALVFLSLCFL